jgi:hypothetical protein
LTDRVQERVDVAPALRIAGLGELSTRVQGHDNDRGQDGDDTDNDQDLNKRETLLLLSSNSLHRCIFMMMSDNTE